MSEALERVPAVEGWFTLDEREPALLGSRCTACGTVFFPKELFFCRNPRCDSTELTEVPLSRRGKLWSVTTSNYPPPPPYPRTEPFEPYAVAAVELAAEKMVVLGQVVPGVAVDSLEVGMEMELTLGTLAREDGRELLVWKWRPAGREAAR